MEVEVGWSWGGVEVELLCWLVLGGFGFVGLAWVGLGRVGLS